MTLLPDSAPTPQPIAPRHEMERAATPRRRAARRVGWLLAVVSSLGVALASLANPIPQIATYVFIGLLLVLLPAMLLAAGLLIIGYRAFHGQARGFILWTAIFVLSVWIGNQPLPPALNPLASALLTVVTLWGFVAALAIGPTLLLYLVRTDRSIVLFAITYLLLVWLLFSLGQYLGWDNLLLRLMIAPTGQSLWLLQGLMCIGIWVTLAAALAFLWNTAKFIKREHAGIVRDHERGTAHSD